jgi:hypothetical protein
MPPEQYIPQGRLGSHLFVREFKVAFGGAAKQCRGLDHLMVFVSKEVGCEALKIGPSVQEKTDCISPFYSVRP